MTTDIKRESKLGYLQRLWALRQSSKLAEGSIVMVRKWNPVKTIDRNPLIKPWIIAFPR